MKKVIGRTVSLFIFFVLVFQIDRAVFMLLYHSRIQAGVFDYLAACRHGLGMDMSASAYLCLVPALLLTAGLWTDRAWLRRLLRFFMLGEAMLISIISVCDIILYDHWNFRLDSTPLFYLFSSPAAAFASATWGELFAGVLFWCISVVILYFLSVLIVSPAVISTGAMKAGRRRTWRTAGSLLFTALLIIPMRGGITVSTMNPGNAYFSERPRLNHSAVNPAFSLLYSLTHSSDFSSQYRFMDTSEADDLINSLNESTGNGADMSWLNTERPDIYLIILESFSAHLVPSMGGIAVAERLDSIASTGVIFDNFYASSFRTDRALPAILNGFPSQPSTSIIKFTSKTEHLPSLAAQLDSLGYMTRYFYGGDINFTNMNSLLVSGGFREIVSDAQFMVNPLASKWGAPDHMVFDEALSRSEELTQEAPPQFMVIQTSSSHEPFDVPFSATRFSADRRLNAFAYTDSCLAQFVNTVSAGSRGDRALFVIVPDHQGAYPDNLENPLERHHIPLVFAGNALSLKGVRISRLGSQPDIAPTILSALGAQTDAFPYGHNLMRSGDGGYAYFSEPGLAAIVTPTDTAVVNIDAGSAALSGGTHSDTLINTIKAYIQRLYDAMDAL